MTSTWRERLNRCSRRRRSFGPSFLVVSVTLALASVLVPSQAAEADHARAVAQFPAFGVGLERCTFIDRSRHVLNYSTTPNSILATNRTLVTEIRYPTLYVAGGPRESVGAAPVARSGGYPMIVFAHGYDVTPDTFAQLLDAWTRAGFVVVAPLFPDEKPAAITAQHYANTEGDLENEPADLAFVTREVLQASSSLTAACPIVNGLVDASELALAGHSDGANAVAMLSYDHGNDPQGIRFAALRTGLDYRAVVILSGDEVTGHTYAAEAGRPALLVVQSLTDQCNPIKYVVRLYDTIHQSNKWFLELRNAHHLPPFDGADAPAFRVVAATSTRFLQITLQGLTFPTPFLAYGNETPSVARMYNNGLGSALDNPPRLVEYCGMN
jgi:hypothetical protein